MFKQSSPFSAVIAVKALVAVFVLGLFLQATSLIRNSSFRVEHILSQYSTSPSNAQAHELPPVYSYGKSSCVPILSRQFADEAMRNSSQCHNNSPFFKPKTRIATVTAHFGNPQDHYQKALQTHMAHGIVHNTELHVMCDPLVDDLWNKPAFILSVLMKEMMKPAEERLEWIMWVDRDTIILDQCRPAASFLPSYFREANSSTTIESENEVNLLVTNDFNGLNNGIFFLRVNRWAIELFNTILAFRYYEPDVDLPFTEQSAMEIIMKGDKFQKETQLVPQEWFNTYPQGEAEAYRIREEEEGLETYHARRGDFLVHFAGVGEKGKAINDWLEVLTKMDSIWDSGRVLRDSTPKIARFWERSGYSR